RKVSTLRRASAVPQSSGPRAFSWIAAARRARPIPPGELPAPPNPSNPLFTSPPPLAPAPGSPLCGGGAGGRPPRGGGAGGARAWGPGPRVRAGRRGRRGRGARRQRRRGRPSGRRRGGGGESATWDGPFGPGARGASGGLDGETTDPERDPARHLATSFGDV